MQKTISRDIKLISTFCSIYLGSYLIIPNYYFWRKKLFSFSLSTIGSLTLEIWLNLLFKTIKQLTLS